ncbi:MAG: dockerin type I domain-containing protein, partial [Planctomycetota bacterium]
SDLGVIVGVVSASSSPEFNGRAAAWVPNGKGGYSVHELAALPGNAIGQATAVNNLGDIVGYSSNGTFRTATLFRIGAAPVNLGVAGLFDPQDVNERRVVVDRSFTARRLDLDTMALEDLGTPGTGYVASTAAAINEHDQIAGLVIRATSTSCDREAAVHDGDAGWQIFSICGPYNGAQDINDRGDVVMTVQLASYLRIPGEGSFLIESLIDAPTGTWTAFTLSGLSINNRRQIAMSANNSALGLAGCIRLTPAGRLGDIVMTVQLASYLRIPGEGAFLIESLIDAPTGTWTAFTLSGLSINNRRQIAMSANNSALGVAGCIRLTPAGRLGDIDGDGTVGATDLAALLGAWGACAGCAADIDGDGSVGATDLAALLGAWG